MGNRVNLTNRRKQGKFNTRAKKKFLKLLEETGNLTQSAAAVGVSTVCVYNHLKKDPDLAEAVDIARDKACVEIEAEIRRRAIKGVKKDVWYQGDVVGEETVYSDKMLELMARAIHPAYGKLGDNLGHHAKPSVNITINTGVRDKLANLLDISLDDIQQDDDNDGEYDNHSE